VIEARAYNGLVAAWPEIRRPAGAFAAQGAGPGGFAVTKRRTAIALSHPDMPDPTVLERIADRLRERIGATRVIVYGSVARGKATLDSDIDLLVVAPSDEKGYLRMANARAAIRDLSFGLPVSPLVLTPDEVARQIERGDPFVREIVEQGVEL
jgi:predicted nucleotidyltransferase